MDSGTRTGFDALARFTPGFIFPCAQRCFISRDIFLRAAALILRIEVDGLPSGVRSSLRLEVPK
jgi:hypothetical protein